MEPIKQHKMGTSKQHNNFYYLYPRFYSAKKHKIPHPSRSKTSSLSALLLGMIAGRFTYCTYSQSKGEFCPEKKKELKLTSTQIKAIQEHLVRIQQLLGELDSSSNSANNDCKEKESKAANNNPTSQI